MQMGCDGMKHTCLGAKVYSPRRPCSLQLPDLPVMGVEAWREAVYRAILGALLYLNFCQCEN